MHLTTLKTLTKRARLAGVAAITLSATAAQSMPFDNVFIFGDSLVDSGNREILDGPGFVPSPLGYFEGRVSNGPALGDFITRFTSVDDLATPSLQGGNNYSVAGARLRDNTNDLGPNSDTTPDLRAQVDSYLTALGSPPGSNDLFVLNAGGNDLRDLAFGVPDLPSVDAEIDPGNSLPPELNSALFIASAAQQLVDVVVALEFSGVDNILLMLPSDTSRSPEAIAFANSPGNTFGTPEDLLALFRAGSEALRDTILLRLGLRTMDFASDLRTFDYLPFTDAFLAAPEDFGFAADVNVTDACLGNAPGSGTPDIDCSGFAFFDSIHPTTALHEQIAFAAVSQTFGIRTVNVSEPATLALLGLGLAGAVTLRRRKAA